MGMRAKRAKAQSQAPEATGALTGKAGEHLTVFVLLLIVSFLAYVYLGFLPKQEQARVVAFDYRNPLLSAVPGDCVGARASDDPGSEMCFIVRQSVLRPNRGPATLPGHTELRRTLPYVALDLHVATSGVLGCGGPLPTTTLRAFNHFGLDPASQVAVERIVPVWAKWSGGKEGILYEVTMRRFDSNSMYVSFISPDVPITGLVKQEILGEKSADNVWYTEIDCGN